MSTCYGGALGVSRKSAEWSNALCHKPGSAGFASLKGCWGLGFHQSHFFAEGTKLAASAIPREAVLQKVIRMELDMEKGTLCFVSECDDKEIEIGEIQASFRENYPLMFAISSCCGHSTEINVLLDETLP